MPEIKIKRSQVAAFLNTGTTETPIWSKMGKGITEQTIAYNPQATTENYIHEDSATTSIDSYQVNISTPQTAYTGEPVFDYVDKIRQTRGVGAAAETEILLVYLYTASPYKAELNKASLQVDDFGGEGGGNVVLNYTINLNGDPKLGAVVVTEGKQLYTAKGLSD